MWEKTTGKGVSLGTLLGAVCSISAWMIDASLYEGGLGDFMKNTGKEFYFDLNQRLDQNFNLKLHHQY